MNVFEAIETRRAVKQYDANHQLTSEEEKLLFDLALKSPTAFNIQNWRFVVVKDKKLRRQIRAAAWDQAQVTDASLLIVLCADTKSWERNPDRYWQNADAGVQQFMLPMIDNYYRGHDQVQRDEAMRSCGMAAQTLMLTAKAMGYDSCPMDGFDFDAVGKLINLPEHHIISMFVTIGKSTQEPWPRPGQLAVNEVVVTDRF